MEIETFKVKNWEELRKLVSKTDWTKQALVVVGSAVDHLGKSKKLSEIRFAQIYLNSQVSIEEFMLRSTFK
uniref:Uncharacterized protein n=1 Tax=viral metagenome TaxID=1070528 RepID=A0A6M3JMS0_9ZZZZ